MVPGSHHWPILCTRKADTRVSFTAVTVPIPEDQTPASVVMEPGDVLYFHNPSVGRFRRALIEHYIHGDAQQVADYYHPALRMDGTPVELATSPDGGPCSEWVDHAGEPVIAMTGQHAVTRKHE